MSRDYLQAFLKHPILDAYLKMNLIVSLVPTTLIPLGILMAVYSTLTKSELAAAVQNGGGGGGSGIPLVSLTDPVMQKYMGLFGISELTALTLVPFAFLLGRDLFEKVIHDYTNIEEIGKKRSSSRSPKQSGGGVGMALADIPVLNSFLQIQGSSQLTPATLVPLGILAAAYYALHPTEPATKKSPRPRSRPPQQEGGAGGGGGLQSILHTPTVQSYLNMMGIGLLTPQTLLPFALIISKEVFETYVRNHAQTVKKINDIL
jgi:hypothetical protein